MARRRLSRLCALCNCVLLFSACSAADAQETARLDLTINGITDISGTLAIAVFATETTFESRSNQVAEARLPVRARSMSWTFELTAPASYAIIVFQDTNGNGELDLGRFGIPQEPYGFSNNARSAFGPPGFRKARIEFDTGNLTHEIDLR